MPEATEETAAKPEKPIKPISWDLRDLKLPRLEMMQAIQSAKTVPDAAKSFLIAHVNQMPVSVRFLRLDAHCHYVGAQMILTASISPI